MTRSALATSTRRSCLALCLAALTLLAGCTRMPNTGVTVMKPASLAELTAELLRTPPDLELFRLRGPFDVTVKQDFAVRPAATESVTADLYLSAAGGRAPLVVLLHGYDNSKEDHAYQAYHLASWGIHSLSVQLRNHGPWIGNGKTLAKIANLLRRHPEAVDSRVDPDRIILAGHSFGGYSVAVALAEGAPAAGGILLDPAGVGRALPQYLRRIRAPVAIIASDENITLTRDRSFFYEYIRSDVLEVSIAGAQHDDARFPLEPEPGESEAESSARAEARIAFLSALTAAAVSLGFAGNLDYGFAGFGAAVRTGKLFDLLRK